MTINKRMIFYVRNEEIFNKLKMEGKRSDVFNMLVEDYYSQDLKYLKQKQQELSEQTELINLKIKNKEEQNQLIKNQNEQEKERVKDIKIGKKFSDYLFNIFKNKKITEDDYFKICDIKDLNAKVNYLKTIYIDFDRKLFFVSLIIYNSKVYKVFILIKYNLLGGLTKEGQEITQTPLIITQ